MKLEAFGGSVVCQENFNSLKTSRTWLYERILSFYCCFEYFSHYYVEVSRPSSYLRPANLNLLHSVGLTLKSFLKKDSKQINQESPLTLPPLLLTIFFYF